MVKVADGFHLWSERYDRELSDVFALQDEIAAAIANALKLKLAPSAPLARHTPPLPAFEAYLKAMHWSYQITPDSVALAKKSSEEAIALDPQYALAYAFLAELTTREVTALGKRAREAMPRARKFALTALDLDPDEPMAHATLGLIAAAYDYDWKESERHFRRAIAANPVPPQVRMMYSAFHLAAFQRFQEGMENMESAFVQDPLWTLGRILFAFSLFSAGMPDRAIAECATARELDPHHWYTDNVLTQVYLGMGDLEKALECAERAGAAAPFSTRTQAMLAGLLKLTGNLARAEALVGKLRALPEHQTGGAMMQYHAVCREWDATADCFERAVEHRDPMIVPAIGTPYFAPMRAHPRWPALIKMINFPAA